MRFGLGSILPGSLRTLAGKCSPPAGGYKVPSPADEISYMFFFPSHHLGRPISLSIPDEVVRPLESSFPKQMSLPLLPSLDLGKSFKTWLCLRLPMSFFNKLDQAGDFKELSSC